MDYFIVDEIKMMNIQTRSWQTFSLWEATALL